MMRQDRSLLFGAGNSSAAQQREALVFGKGPHGRRRRMVDEGSFLSNNKAAATMENPGATNTNSSNLGSVVVVDARMHETATTLVDDLANNLVSHGENNQTLLTAATTNDTAVVASLDTGRNTETSPRSTLANNPATGTGTAVAVGCTMSTLLSSIGLGSISDFRIGGGTILPSTPHQPDSCSSTGSSSSREDATEAAVKAVQDAIERADFGRRAAASVAAAAAAGNNTNVHLHIRLGVPGKTVRPSEPMHVDLSRILTNLAVLLQTIPVRRVEVTVGGLLVEEHHHEGWQSFEHHHFHHDHLRDTSSFAAEAHHSPATSAAPSSHLILGTCAVVACLVLQQDVLPRAESPPLPSAEESSLTTATNAANCGHPHHCHDHHHSSTSLPVIPTTWAELEEQMSGNGSSPSTTAATTTRTAALATTGLEHQHHALLHQHHHEHFLSSPATAAKSHLEQPISFKSSRAHDDFHRSTSMDMLAHISVEMQKQEEPDHEAMCSSSCCDRNNNNIGNHDVSNPVTNYKKLPPGVTSKQNQRRFVQHNYQDHSHEMPTTEEELALVRPGAPERTLSAAFPLKLHEILSNIERDGLEAIVGWLPHGRSFKIHQQNEFVEQVLPKYFVMTKKSSFLRQLNLYGFNRLSGVGPDQGSYYHEKFLRGMKFLCRRMMRQKVNGNGIRAAGNPDSEPVLTRYPTCPPVPLQRMLREQAFSAPVPSSSQRVDSSASWSDLSHTAPVVTSSAAVAVTSRNAIATTKAPSALPSKARRDSPDSMLRTTGAQVSFPLKLQRILDKLESEGSHDIISWLHHGRAFMVHDPDRFVSDILTVYFNQTKYSSFQRQLHMYNFQRITAGSDRGAYHHVHFLRGRPQLSLQMHRTRVNGKGTRRPGNPMEEPDFSHLLALPQIAAGTHIDIPVGTASAPAPDSTTSTAGFPFCHDEEEEEH